VNVGENTTTEEVPMMPQSATKAANARAAALAGLPVVERRLELAGISTAVLEGGSGAPLVLLHGPGEHAAKWLRVLPGLTESHRVVAPDLPGHGATDVSDRELDVARVLAWMSDLVARTCSRPPIVVGHVLGGAIAARFAARQGARIRHLVLADALGLVPFQPDPAFGKALTEFVSQPDGESHDRLWQHCAFDLDRLRDAMGGQWERLRAYTLDRAGVPGLAQAQGALMEQFGLPAIPADELRAITVPTTLVWGRHDLATPLRVAEAASERYGWPLVVIEDAADDPAMDRPDAFTDVLRRIP
jgi:pimeloyl-ACP methyl ester carboxylesterase